MDFWQKLKKDKDKDKKPIVVLAPMADVTDSAFRKIIAKYGKPDVFWTEFVSADGLVLAPEEGKKKLLEGLKFSKKEHPIVAQLFSSKPENMKKSAKLVQDLGFDGIDINMGCPDRSIEKQGCGAAMIKNPDLAKEIILSAKDGAPNLPVSVKIRLGYNQDNMEDWLKFLLKTNPSVITIHARTRKEMSKVPAKWHRIKTAVQIRDELKSNTLIFGNGDVTSLQMAYDKFKETNCDGVMIGRGIFGNPWFFSGYTPTIKEKLIVAVEHAKLFEKEIEYKNFAVMKKHFKAYIEGFDGAKELRHKLMDTNSAEEVSEIINLWLKEHK
ncbi:MAG TPA: tRNA-dihydrouridine synthase [Candidatus Paceibacterota bacterium]|nr:tRNA-dihydrouridine synthase [Candidatus Paceibacterota bacterium]HMP19114.1 tRNA-dihydrouridine synthase [Candidatus Paceibacterota bacterium]